jgi:hypothetical protein
MIPLTGEGSKASDTIGKLWCRLIHGSPMWPIHGHYRCRICMRQYAVPWAGGPMRVGPHE